MIVARILKFVPICNRFCGAITSAGPLPALTPVDHTFTKGEMVAYEYGAPQLWKGHQVRGAIRLLTDVIPSDELAHYTPMEGDQLTKPDDWGLS